MTHDELLIRLKEGQWVDKDEMHRRSNALRAIVKLHTGTGISNRCVSCSNGNPCETIQVIEKELS